MKCQDLQLNLPLFSDDVLSADEGVVLREHLDSCPLCRQKLADFQDLRNSLRGMTRPELSASIFDSLRNRVAFHLVSGTSSPGFQLVDDRRNWLDVWLMPYTVGAMTSLLVGFMMIWVIMSNDFQPIQYSAENGIDLTPLEYANSRSDFAGESPSVNPRGALIDLTNSFIQGEIKDDEVVVVADVFGNGFAHIAEVVEPSSDRRAVAKLQKALESDASFAPFVPASLDQRSETIRVVLKIQSVNVNTSLH